MSVVYVLLAIVTLVLIVGIGVVLGRKPGQRTMSPLGAIGAAFVVAGIAFGDDRVIAYTLLGTGMALALADGFRRSIR